MEEIAVEIIQKEDLAKLNQDEAEDLVRRLVLADAEESGIQPNRIHFSSETNAPDGGIDGKVDGVVEESKWGTIKKGLTCYQIKSGNYRINESGIKKLFYDTDKLKPEIENCLKNGTLVIVLTGQDLPTYPEEKKIYERLGRKVSIEIWPQSKLIDYLERHPKLCLQTLKMRNHSFYYHDDWAAQVDMRHKMVPAPKQAEFIADLQQRLRSEPLAEHIRITGAHGIGKTRLVLEALRQEDLSRQCIYTRDPGGFMQSKFFRHLAVRRDLVRAIFVVDECPDGDMEYIWSQINKHGNRIKLITIYDKPSQQEHHTTSLTVPELDSTQIKQILESYVGPQYRADVLYKADVWSKECGSSPRAAHIIGEDLRSDHNNIPRQPGTSVLEGFIAYKSDITGEAFEKRKKVLLWACQFRRFGCGESHTSELKIMEDKIKECMGIEKSDFAEMVEELRQIGILRGSDTLCVEPKILHVWLWREWRRKYGNLLEPFSLDGMWENAQSDSTHRNVLGWHVNMWQYDEPNSPRHVVKEVFSPGGFAERHSLLNSYLGAELLYKMAKASPEDAVEYLERYMRPLDMDGLRQFRVGRWGAASILVEAAGCSSLFRRAARVLLLLAGTGSQEADDADDYMFAKLFLPAAGPIGWTEMPPIERVSILKQALTHRIIGFRLAGIKACAAALQTRNFVKDIVDDEAWQRGVCWWPNDRMEYIAYYRKVLDTARLSLKSLNKEDRSQLANAILPYIRNLLEAPELRDPILMLLREMHGEQHVDPEIIGTISGCLVYGSDGMPEDLRHELSLLHDEIVGDDYRGQMRRYVAMKVDSDPQTPDKIWQETMAKLAKMSLNDPQAFSQELVWLVTDEATYGYGFGYTLGKMDDGTLFANICDAQRQCVKSNATFLGGYLRAVFDRDMSEWEKLMDSLAADATLHELVPALTHMSGMTNRAAARILELVESKVDPLALRVFKSETLVCKVPEHVFQKWLELLVGGNTEAYEVALELYYRYYMRGKQHIPDSVSELLFPRIDSYRIRHSSGQAKYFWSEILVSCVVQGTVAGDVVSNVVDTVLTIDAYSILDTDLIPALEAVTEHYPNKTWEAISTIIDPDKNQSIHTPMVMYAFSVNKILVEKITPAVMCGWIDEDIGRRAVIAARLLSHDIKAAAEYAAKYGGVEGVKEALKPTWETFSGSSLEHYGNKIKTIDSLLAVENRPIVREFLEDYRDALSERCEYA